MMMNFGDDAEISTRELFAFDAVFENPLDPSISRERRKVFAALRDFGAPRRLLHDPGGNAAMRALLTFDCARRTAHDGLAFDMGAVEPGDFAPECGWRGLWNLPRIGFAPVDPFRPLVFVGERQGEAFALIVSPSPPPGRCSCWVSRWIVRRRTAIAVASFVVAFTPSGVIECVAADDIGDRVSGETPAARDIRNKREAVGLANMAGAFIAAARSNKIWTGLDGRRSFLRPDARSSPETRCGLSQQSQ